MQTKPPLFIILFMLIVSLLSPARCHAEALTRLAGQFIRTCQHALGVDLAAWPYADNLESITIKLDPSHSNGALIKKLNDRSFQPTYIAKVPTPNDKAHYREPSVLVNAQPVPTVIRVEMPGGIIFRRLSNHYRLKVLGVAWLDESTGLIWSAPHPDKTVYENAAKICKNITDRDLPTVEEFRIFAANSGNMLLGIDMLLGTTWKYFFWTSTEQGYIVFSMAGHSKYHIDMNDEFHASNRPFICVMPSR